MSEEIGIDIQVEEEEIAIEIENDALKGEKGEKGDSGVYIGTEEPIDETINVWINPKESDDEEVTKGYVKETIENAMWDKVTFDYVDNAVSDKATISYVDELVGDINTILSTLTTVGGNE